MDTIKNCNTGSIDELKEKRKVITIIRQYINTFGEKLQTVYVNKSSFEKKLFIMNIDQLNVILEDIRINLNLDRNKNSFNNIVEFSLKGIEQVGSYSGYNMDGLTNELMNDPQFILDLQIISCEIDVSAYINPKMSALLKVVKTGYMQNKKHEIKQNVSNVINDQKLELIKNLEVKK